MRKKQRHSCRVSVEPSISSSPTKLKVKTIENVLVLQPFSSLRAFGCGLFQAIAKVIYYQNIVIFMHTHIFLLSHSINNMSTTSFDYENWM
jgi:hypothetical protein